MADPRKVIDFEGIGGRYETYQIDGSTTTFSVTAARGSTAVDKAVTLSGNGTIALAADGNLILGRLERVESDGMANVQTGGHTTLPAGNGATVTYGSKFVGAVGAGGGTDRGYIRNAAPATAAELGGRGNRIVDASVTTAVKVDLG